MRYRKTVTVICLLLIPVLAAGLYFTKVPTHTSLEKAFRQAERAAMVGPGRIITTIEDEKYHHDLIAASTDYGAMIYTQRQLSYRKMGDTPVIMTGNCFSSSAISVTQMPVFLFHRCQGAAAAKLELNVPNVHLFHQKESSFTYLLESETTYDGLFRFTLRIGGEDANKLDERNGLWELYRLCCGNGHSLFHTVSATAWLYDSAGNLLETHEITIRDFEGEAQAEQNKFP